MSANNAEPRKLGLNQVFPDPSDDPGTTNIDIIAIHGLDTQSPKAWVAWKKDGDPTSGEVHWLRDENMLPSVIPNARIFTYDWNANFDRNPATDILLGHADGLLDRLHIRRSKDRSDRPIIFIASCFGGLLLVKSLHRAREVPEYQGILRSTVGVAFLGTPFRGSHESFYSATQLRAIVAIHMGREASSELIKYLDARGAELDELVQRFCEMVEHHEFKFPIVCFYETQRTDFSKVVKELPIEFVKCLNSDSTGILVERHSACLQGPRRIGLDVRHAMLNKYAGPEDDAFVRVSFRVKQFVGGAQEILQAKTPASRKKRPRSTVPFDKDKKKLKKKAIDENGQKDAAQNSSQTVDQYLESIALPSAFIPEIGAPQRQATVSRLLNIRSSLDWFFDSPEFEAWISGKSSFLWCSGIPKSGKTVLSCYLKNYLSDREAHMRGREIISIFCTSVKEQMGTIEIDRILGYIASRLLRNDKNRLQNVSQQRPPQDWLPARIPLSFEGNFLQSLWGLVWDSMTASSNREVVLLLDGVNEIGPEEAREAFLSNIVTYFNRAKSEIHITLKVFVTSLPFEDVQKAFKDLPSIEKDKERQACLRTLHFEEYNARQNRVLTAEEKTGDWILSHSKFKEWDESSDSGLLWIHGKPGSGKSTLVKRIVAWKSNESTKLVQTKSRNISHSHPEKARTLEEADTEYVDQLATDRDIIIAAFFYSFRGGKTETSHTLMLRSLLYQILKGNSKLFPSFQSAYRELSKAKGSPEWSYESLKSVFNSLRRGQTQLSIYIAVDAMDESETARKPEILDFLSDLRSSKSPCVFKVLIASRPHPDIQIRLKGCGYIILQNENLPDIKTVVIKGLYGLSKKHEISEGTFDRVQNDLIERCEGVFLWVSLVLRELEELVPDGFSEVEITTLLKSLPSDLVEFYKRIVKRLKENCKGQICGGKKMLAWAAFAERPMTTDEFGDAVIIPSDPEPFPPSDSFISQSRISHFERRIARNCGGLLEIRPGNIVQLLHQTTRDFILDKSRAAEPFDTDQLRGDTEIAIVCLRYLGLILQSGGDREQNEMQEIQNFVKELSDRPLLDYTLACLPKHFHHLRQNYGVPKIVNDELTRLIETLQKSPQSQAYNLLGRWCEKDLGCPIELKIDIEFAKQARNAMLVTAAREGHLSVVISLLRAHAEINGLSSGLSPLGEAASKGYVAVVQLLLEKGAARDNYGRTPLLYAAANGHEGAVKLLVEKGADLESRDKAGRTPLSYAAADGHEAGIKLLVDKGANLELRDKAGWAPLSYAAANGHEGLVKLLLAAG
ncbi:hypothetical protein DL98DRAFT_475129 [Cadophora sp. DSE1049]|nr:hypothetical protein DL98DRAFT_475129 [Cadophora sp. DSE1049]